MADSPISPLHPFSPLPPLLRGLLAAGGPGPFVHTGDAPTAGADLTVASPADADPAAVLDVLGPAVAAFRARNGRFPRRLASGGAVYGIGSSYDAAVLAACSAAAAGEAGSTADGQAGRRGRMAGKICLVTGGAQGFGEEIVRHLVAEGGFVYIADLNAAKAAALAGELSAAAGATVARPLAVDVADEASVAALAAGVAADSGGLDLFVANAGVLRAGSVKEMSKVDFDFVTSINYTAYFLGVKRLSPLMALQNLPTGRYTADIIQINSKSGLEGSNKNGAYAGGKFGGIGLTQSFALELIADNIKVNSICPGNFFDGPLWSDPDKGLFVQYLNTGKVPGAKTVADVKRFYEAKVPMGRGCAGLDVARAIYYAVEQQYETGQAIPVTGGQVMLN
jgi:sorbitol-6-phosphate 2-dehydrogenase